MDFKVQVRPSPDGVQKWCSVPAVLEPLPNQSRRYPQPAESNMEEKNELRCKIQGWQNFDLTTTGDQSCSGICIASSRINGIRLLCLQPLAGQAQRRRLRYCQNWDSGALLTLPLRVGSALATKHQPVLPAWVFVLLPLLMLPPKLCMVAYKDGAMPRYQLVARRANRSARSLNSIPCPRILRQCCICHFSGMHRLGVIWVGL